jgi:hypothetical protein
LGCLLGYLIPFPENSLKVGACVFMYMIIEGYANYLATFTDTGVLAEATNAKVCFNWLVSTA